MVFTLFQLWICKALICQYRSLWEYLRCVIYHFAFLSDLSQIARKRFTANPKRFTAWKSLK